MSRKCLAARHVACAARLGRVRTRAGSALRRPDASPSGRISQVSRKYLGGVWRCLGSVAEREDRAAVEVVPRLAEGTTG